MFADVEEHMLNLIDFFEFVTGCFSRMKGHSEFTIFVPVS